MTKRIIYRDSETGQLTTQGYAAKHPKTTEREKVNVPSPKRGK